MGEGEAWGTFTQKDSFASIFASKKYIYSIHGSELKKPQHVELTVKNSLSKIHFSAKRVDPPPSLNLLYPCGNYKIGCWRLDISRPFADYIVRVHKADISGNYGRFCRYKQYTYIAKKPNLVFCGWVQFSWFFLSKFCILWYWKTQKADISGNYGRFCRYRQYTYI